MGAPHSITFRGAGSRRCAGGRRLAVVGGLALGLGLVPQALAAPIAPTFGAASGSPFAAGNGPTGLALGTFTSDANLDLAVADEGSMSGNSVTTILGGNGAGGLSSVSTPSVGNRPSAIATGTFDAGTTLDLAVVNRGSETVSILRGNGNGTFTASPSVAVGNRPQAIAVGDVDNDGRLDLAVANRDDDDVRILKGNGSGGFTAVSPDPGTGSDPMAVLLVRLNGDANLDLVTANEGANSVTVRLGNGNGTFGSSSTVAVGNDPAGLAAGDVNLDGALDVVVANSGTGGTGNSVSILLGNGAGGLTAHATRPSTGTGSAPSAVAVGDLNGDADPDIVTANTDNDRASVFAGNGDGTFAARTDLTVGNEPVAVAVGDLNTDGRQDLVLGNFNSDNVSVLLNTTATTVSVTAPSALSFGSAAVGASVGPLAQAVTVVSNARGGYQLSVARTAFTRGDIPLGVSTGAAPAGAVSDLGAGTSPIPTSGGQNIGHRTLTVTRSTGDTWDLGLTLGPVPLVADGAHSSTLTYTVVALP